MHDERFYNLDSITKHSTGRVLGKRPDSLNLPYNDSLSMTLDEEKIRTRGEISFSGSATTRFTGKAIAMQTKNSHHSKPLNPLCNLQKKVKYEPGYYRKEAD